MAPRAEGWGVGAGGVRGRHREEAEEVVAAVDEGGGEAVLVGAPARALARELTLLRLGIEQARLQRRVQQLAHSCPKRLPLRRRHLLPPRLSAPRAGRRATVAGAGAGAGAGAPGRGMPALRGRRRAARPTPRPARARSPRRLPGRRST